MSREEPQSSAVSIPFSPLNRTALGHCRMYPPNTGSGMSPWMGILHPQSPAPFSRPRRISGNLYHSVSGQLWEEDANETQKGKWALQISVPVLDKLRLPSSSYSPNSKDTRRCLSSINVGEPYHKCIDRSFKVCTNREKGLRLRR
jgi:hypothetical protein